MWFRRIRVLLKNIFIHINVVKFYCKSSCCSVEESETI